MGADLVPHDGRVRNKTKMVPQVQKKMVKFVSKLDCEGQVSSGLRCAEGKEESWKMLFQGGLSK